MLVLSRKLNEEVVIAGEIRVRILEVRRGRVRLGVSAPPEVTVDRAETAPRTPGNSRGAAFRAAVMSGAQSVILGAS